MTQWFFKEHNGTDDVNNSSAEDSFLDQSIPNLAVALVREGIQNALDARRDDLPDDQPVRVRLALTRVKGNDSPDTFNGRWFGNLFDHLQAEDSGAPNPPAVDETCDLLLFEDFGTVGLTGNYLESYRPYTQNNYCNFLYHDGVTVKGRGNQRGSRGVGKIVFAMASRARTFFVYTIRENDPDQPVLTGKCRLKYRSLRDQSYLGPGYFLDDWPKDQARQPVTDPVAIQQFLEAFPVTRQQGQTGLSVAIPFPAQEIDAEQLRLAVIAEYHYALLAGKLEVVIEHQGRVETFNAGHVPSIGNKEIDANVDLARWALKLPDGPSLATLPPASTKLQKLEPEHVPADVQAKIIELLDQGQRVAVRMPLYVHPRDKEPQLGHFDLFLEPSDETISKPSFIRNLLPVTHVREGKTAPRVRSLVVINEPPLAHLLRAAEGANHTDWTPRTDLFSKNYLGRLGEIAFVATAAARLFSIVRGDNDQPVGGIATHFFSARLPDKPQKPGKRTSGKGDKPENPEDPPPSKPKRWSILQQDDGFVIKKGDEGAQVPSLITVRVAYDVLRGNAWKQYDPADFDLTHPKSGIRIIAQNAIINTQDGKGNRFTIEPENQDFEVYVTGFDINRDLIIDPTAPKEDPHAHATELHESQETQGY